MRGFLAEHLHSVPAVVELAAVREAWVHQGESPVLSDVDDVPRRPGPADSPGQAPPPWPPSEAQETSKIVVCTLSRQDVLDRLRQAFIGTGARAGGSQAFKWSLPFRCDYQTPARALTM